MDIQVSSSSDQCTMSIRALRTSTLSILRAASIAARMTCCTLLLENTIGSSPLAFTPAPYVLSLQISASSQFSPFGFRKRRFAPIDSCVSAQCSITERQMTAPKVLRWNGVCIKSRASSRNERLSVPSILIMTSCSNRPYKLIARSMTFASSNHSAAVFLETRSLRRCNGAHFPGLKVRQCACGGEGPPA